MANINVSFNADKNGIEIRFNCKPNDETLSILKHNGYRWSNRQKMWYAKQNDQTIGVANSLTNDSVVFDDKRNKSNNNEYDLWALTRIDTIENHVDEQKRTKQIALEARKHIKSRFPMCSISITSDYNSISAYINASPFEIESDELNAIRKYIYKYISSYKYCTDYDPYGDYGSSYNFYFHDCCIGYGYKKTDMNVSVGNICEDFQQKKQAFEKAENERKAKELEESIQRRMIEHEESEKRRKNEEAQRNRIQSNVSEKSVEYFVEDMVDYGCRKQNSTDEYHEYNDDDQIMRHTCKVTKEVYMDRQQYDFFKNHLMMDWSFIAGTGGTHTDDQRINSMLDYNMMPKAEQETVEWYDTNCVAIFCDGKPMCVVDAQGYDYCRYVYFYDDKTRVVEEHKSNQVISDKQVDKNKLSAEALIDVSTQVIEENDIIDTWDTESVDVYKAAMKEHINNSGIRFDMDVIRAIDEDNEKFKRVMYNLFMEINSIQGQFDNACLNYGQKITIVKMGAFGGISIIRSVFDSCKHTKYAQYNDVVKLIIKPEHKRKLHYMYIYDDVLIYNGWMPDIPEEMFWEINDNGNGIITKRGRYSSFDYKQYKVVFEYYKKLGATPIIDTRDQGRYR